MCLDIGKKGKKKMCEFYLFLVCLQREEREREKMHAFTFLPVLIM